MDVDLIDPSECLINNRTILKSPEEDSKTAYLSVVPSTIKFSFNAKDLKIQEKTVEITNYFSKSCPIQLSPLDTQHFRIDNTLQRKWLSPGAVHKISIRFIPDEIRDYNSILKIRYFESRILQIKIIAKIKNTIVFPTNINFGNVPLYQVVHHKLPIYSYGEKKISFVILPSTKHPSVGIFPSSGNVRPDREPVIVKIIYVPLQYITMNFQIRIFLSNQCNTPHIINFHAHTRPGLLRDTLKNVASQIKNKTHLPKASALSPQKPKSISLKKCIPKFSAEKSAIQRTSFEEAPIEQCKYLPVYTLHAVNCILNSKIRKPYSEHELKGPLNVYMSQTLVQKAQKLREFLTKVERYRQQNEQAKIHHRPKVNNEISDMSEIQTTEIKIQREQAWNDYEDMMTTSMEEILFERREVRKIRQRILRTSQKYPNVTSPLFHNGQSCLSYCKIVPFLQAARKIILRNRLLKVLENLRQLTPQLVVDFEEPHKEN